MIDFVEIRNEALTLIGIIDSAQSIIWRSTYYGTGDFEIYIQATRGTVDLLKVGYYVTRNNNPEVGIIESIEITDSYDEGRMIVAKGRFAKSILDRRHIYKLTGTVNTPTILSGKVETALRQLVSNNAIDCTDTRRNIPLLELGAEAGIDKVIIDESGNAAQKQVSYQNLLEYSESVLEEYGMAARVIYDDDDAKLQYVIFAGSDRSADNTAGNIPIVFSKDFDNLTESTYSYDTTDTKNAALIGGEGEGLERFYVLLESNAAGLERRETWVNASSINREYEDDSGTKQQYTDVEYSELLRTEGAADLAEKVVVESFEGSLDITNGIYTYGDDFDIGDIVTVQDNEIGKYINVRISEITEVQDADGYKIDAVYSTK